MQMRDELGTIYDDEVFASVYAEVGQPALAPWRLALVSVMQFAENLSDRQAAEDGFGHGSTGNTLSRFPSMRVDFIIRSLSGISGPTAARKSGKQNAGYLP